MMEKTIATPVLPVGSIGANPPGWIGMICLLLTEGALFVFLLLSYYYFAVQPHPGGTFPPGGAPSMKLSLPNTIVLFASSVAVWWGERGIRFGSVRQLSWGLGLGTVLGLIFMMVQAKEWANKSFTLASDLYGSTYFTITGFHMAHVGAGVLMLAALFLWSLRGYFDAVRYAYVSIGAIYWHFVDAVWITLFFTFYITPLLGVGG
jgi:heme/copper-type cytochrome/quinol oxidase subunit 3